MLVAGIGLVLAGLLAIGFGIPIKEFSTGNTLIVTGVMGICTGAIMLALWAAVRELKNIARRLGAGTPELRPLLPSAATRDSAAPDGGLLFNRDQSAAEDAGGAAPIATPSPPPWQDDAASRDRPRSDGPAPEFAPAELAPSPPKPKRNLLFSSTSRRERERTQARSGEPSPPPPAVPPPVEPAEPPPASFENAWPKAERSKPGEIPPQRRSPASGEADGAPAQDGDQPAVTVLKSGVVDGMAYSLYSDGSIEAQMPEGMMRFASIDELRAHLDQRP
jgi:hypothetical protein